MMGTDKILTRLMALHPKSIDLVLDRIERLLSALGNPQHRLPPVVHVAGTNGKGSTVAFLRAFLEAAGYCVHVYTSPHLVTFNERIRVAGKIISDEDLENVLQACEQANQGLPITFFEITTAAAFLAFVKTPADIVLLETGLGGRLDATNVIEHPRLTCITPVSLDHQHFLGDDVVTIMAEKTGILKSMVPCVVARQGSDEVLNVVVDKAHDLNTPLLIEGTDWPSHLNKDWPQPGLVGEHQIQNAALAVACAKALGVDFKISDAAFQRGLKNVAWPGRLQHITIGPLADMVPDGWQLWLDGGHNVAASKVLSRHLEDGNGGDVFVIFGSLNQRDPVEFLGPLKNQITRLYAVQIPGEENALTADQGVLAAKTLGIKATASATVTEAIGDILAQNNSPHTRARILICGSLYLAGHVLGL